MLALWPGAVGRPVPMAPLKLRIACSIAARCARGSWLFVMRRFVVVGAGGGVAVCRAVERLNLAAHAGAWRQTNAQSLVCWARAVQKLV